MNDMLNMTKAHKQINLQYESQNNRYISGSDKHLQLAYAHLPEK